MKVVRVRNDRSGVEVASSVTVADRWWRRALGLLGRHTLCRQEGVLLEPCGAVHTIGMSFAIDVAFLDVDGRVLSTRQALPPGRLARGGRTVRSTLELHAGALAHADTRPGDRLVFEEGS